MNFGVIPLSLKDDTFKFLLFGGFKLKLQDQTLIFSTSLTDPDSSDLTDL